MKITKRQLRRIIREAIDPRELEEPLGGWAGDALRNDPDYKHGTDTAGFTPLKSFTLPYQGTGYGGRRIISRDKAWLEFVPLGAPSTTQEDMFRAVVLLDNDDPEISKALQRGGPKSMGPIQSYDVYSVYATTTG